MPEIVISGVTVKFPFEPYDVQRNYMESVIKCLDKSEHGMLESPTGLTTNKSIEKKFLCFFMIFPLNTVYRYGQNALFVMRHTGLGRTQYG